MTKFTEGAWVVVVLLPLGVLVLLRLHRQYVKEDEQLEAGAAQACEAPVLRRHMVLVLVDRMDLATARAIQYARTLSPDHLRAVHFAVDPLEAAALERDWSRLGLSRLPLDIIDCPDRRLARRRARARRPDHARRRHRADHAAAPARLRGRVAPAAARPQRRSHRRRGRHTCRT